MKFYGDCAVRAQKCGIVIDFFVAALDQVGVVEMKPCYEMTGGFYIMTDSFGNPVFKESFRKFFELDEATQELKMGFLATTKLHTSKEFKISGVIGQCAPIKQSTVSTYVSPTQIGTGGTNQWYIGGIDRTKSLAVYFDIVATEAKTTQQKVHLQFQTTYQHVNGQKRLRVTTCQRMMAPAEDIRQMAYGFDQETAAILVVRQSVH
jgi:protein transport protein SEC23